MPKFFAPDYERDEQGRIRFPKDDKYRREIFKFWDRLDISMSEHPAKANIYLVKAIVEYVSEMDETVMDIMSGTGTILIAALMGRKVVCIELEEPYQNMIEEAIKDIEAIAPGAADAVTLIPGDCAKVLPLQIADHVIFSPPYTNIMKKKTMVKLDVEMMAPGLLTYSKSPENIGNLSEFMYHQKMEQVYRKVLDSLPPNGTLTIIIKDHIEKGERVYLGNRAERDCIKTGFVLDLHEQWLPPGSAYASFMRARGDMVVDEEDVIVLRKPL